MPDWTYHPFFKPILFRLPAERARRITLRLLAIQARTSVGRRVFRLFGHGRPPDSVAVRAFGLRFPTPIGVAQGIDTEAIAVSVLQYLGPGFLVVGPVGRDPSPRRLATDPARIPEHLAIASSSGAAGIGSAAIAERLSRAPALEIPVGVGLCGPDLAAAIRAAGESPSFFTLPPECAGDTATLRDLRKATLKPLILRIPPDLDDARLDEITDIAVAEGIDGCIAVAGSPCPMQPGGELTGPFLRARSLAVIERVARRHGDRLPVIGSGGIMSPDDALAALDAGAKLIELYEGLVYAGPGLPGRILHAIERRLAASQITPLTDTPTPLPEHPQRDQPGVATNGSVGAIAPALAPRPAGPALAPRPAGWWLVAFTGGALIAAGIAALGLAATVKLLPYDIHYLGMTVQDLCHRNGCRIVHFMAHDRVSFGGAILSIGILYIWLAASPLREGRAWAWWTIALSGVLGFASFLTYLGYGYLDVTHGIATLLLLPVYLTGIVWTRRTLRGPRGIGTLLRRGADAWIYSPAGMGRAAVTFAAIGMILGGATIMAVGVTRVFVPTDLDYMQITVAELNAVNPRLVPLIAHDRAGFGGGLFSGGLTVLFTLWCGAKPGQRGLFIALLASGIAGFACAIGIHPIVGYTNLEHLAPAYAGAAAFAIGMVLLYRPLWHGDRGAQRFPDL